MIKYVLSYVTHIPGTPDDVIWFYGNPSRLAWQWTDDINKAKLFLTQQMAEQEKQELEQLGIRDLQIRMIRR